MAGAVLAGAWGFGRVPVRRMTSNLLSVISMVALLGSAMIYDSSTMFPGMGAVVPVLATCGLLVSRGGVFGGVLSTRVFQYFGNISYSLYLWHWPVLFFAWSAFGDAISMPLATGLVLLSVALADLTYRFIELPLRKPSAAVIGPRPYRTGAVGTAVVAVVAAAMMYVPSLKTGPAYSLMDPLSVSAGDVPSDIEPELAASADSIPVSYGDGCHLGIRDVEPRLDCIYGDPASEKKIALVGDSHAAHWLPGLIEAGRRERVAVYSFTKSACTGADLKLWNGALRREYTECTQWRERVIDAINRLGIDRVILSDHRAHRTTDGGGITDWPAAVESTLAQIGNVPVVVLSSSPEFPHNPAFCLSGNLGDSRACGVPRSDVVDERLNRLERERMEASGMSYIDVNRWLCTDSFCPVVDGKYLIYRDSHHIAVPFSKSMAGRWQGVIG